MERLVFTLITVVLFSGILPGTLLAEDDLPVVDVSTETEAVAESVVGGGADVPVAVVEEAVHEAETEVAIEEAFDEGQAAVEENLGKAETSQMQDYVLQGDWDLHARNDTEVRIRKIYEFLNDPKLTKTGKDKSLEYEFKYFNHGAITKAQRYNREGQYYVVTWTNKGAPADYQLRIDYRQSKTRDKINTITIPYPNAQGTFKGTFSITGDHYYMYGSILSWRISVVRDGAIVAQNKSFVW